MACQNTSSVAHCSSRPIPSPRQCKVTQLTVHHARTAASVSGDRCRSTVCAAWSREAKRERKINHHQFARIVFAENHLKIIGAHRQGKREGCRRSLFISRADQARGEVVSSLGVELDRHRNIGKGTRKSGVCVDPEIRSSGKTFPLFARNSPTDLP